MEEVGGRQKSRLRLLDAKGIRIKGREELQSDLKNMVNNPESSDLTLKCNDGIGLHACRLLLANRCAVFKSMLNNGMLETTLSEIKMVKFSSPVMLAIVEYLYTGTIETYPPVNWKMGFEIMSAAQFFIIPQVEIIAEDFLLREMSSAAGISQKSVLMDMLSIAIEFQETWEGKDAMLLELIDHIGHDWFEEDCYHKLSRSAVEYILSKSKRDVHQGEDEPSVEEYFTLRKAILWHVYEVVPISDVLARTAVQNVLPGEISLTLWRKMLMIPSEIDDYVSCVSTSKDLSSATPVLNSLVGSDICNDSLQQLLRHINLSRIPAPLLFKVVHPLRIIPPQKLLKALFHLALHRPVRYSVAKSDWKHGPSLRIGSEGEIMCGNEKDNDGDERGVAIAFIPLPRSSNTYEWSFEVLEDDAEIMEVGFMCQAAGHVFQDDEMLKEVLEDCSSTRVLSSNREDERIFVSNKEPKSDSRNWKDFAETCLKVNAVVNFKLNVSERTCQVKFGDKQAVWKDLPDGDYYPAVGFSNCTCAKVQLRLVRGFDYF